MTTTTRPHTRPHTRLHTSQARTRVTTRQRELELLNSRDFTKPCATKPDLFFDNTDPISVAEAKQICGDCPVATACLAGALERREPWGVWGGALFEEGRVIRYKRRVGRPRASAGSHLAPVPVLV